MGDIVADRVAIITAGGSGIGAAAARALAAGGFKVAVMSPSGRGETLGKELGGIGVTGSNQSDGDLKRLVDLTMERWGRIDALVNSAGHGPRKPLLELGDDDWQKGMEVYFLSVVRPTRLIAPIMQRQKAGSIVNISSTAGVEPNPAFPTSSVFRAGIAAFARMFADSHAKDNVRMNNVLPGFVDNFPVKPEILAGIPAGRYARLEEIADLVAFLASKKSGYITGQNIRIDGGMTRSV